MDAHQARRQQARGAAVLCLAALLCSLSWVRVLAVTAIAVLDPSHEAQLSQPDGQWRLVLKHQSGTPSEGLRVDQSPGHHHPLGASVLVLLARDATPNQDHVLSLGAVGEMLQEVGEGFSSRPTGAVEGPTFVAVGWSPLRRDSAPHVHPRPPPVPETVPLPLAQIRTTVLLI